MKNILVTFFLLFGFASYGQSTITIEVNWPNWSSENRVTFRDPSNNQIGARICNPSACFNGSGDNSYTNSGSPATYAGVAAGTGYSLLLEDSYGDGWNGGGSYVKVYQDGTLILTSDLTGGSSAIVSFDITKDTDGDGINDNVDIDDDNDGMTDEDEYCTSANVAFLTSSDVGTRTLTFNHTNTGFLKLDLTSLDNSFQLTINTTPIHNSVLEFENGALGAGEIYTLFQSDDSFIVSPWVANINGLPRIRLIIDEMGVVTIYGTRTSISSALEPMHAQGGVAFNTINWINGNNNSFTLVNQDGPGPESIDGSLFLSVICDSDGDGLDNSVDLDSDNDGIYDLWEGGALAISGVNDANNDGVIDGISSDFGANGLFSSVENTDAKYADLTYGISDSDLDGTYDPYELDADNDGCNDVNEAGFTDDDSDGTLGPSPVSVDGNGIVTSGADGYTTPADANSNTTYDFQETGVAPSITSQPTDTAICPGCSTQFSVVASNADGYQWQLFNGSIWVDLTDSGIYSGTNTDTLTITNATPSDNGNQYRAVVTSTLYVCSPMISNSATLNTVVNRVITNRRITFRVNKQ